MMQRGKTLLEYFQNRLFVKNILKFLFVRLFIDSFTLLHDTRSLLFLKLRRSILQIIDDYLLKKKQ